MTDQHNVSSMSIKSFEDPSKIKSNCQKGSFKKRRSFAERKAEVEGIKLKFPSKIPVIIECYEKEKVLPPLDKTKFLLPQELTVAQFATVIRNRLSIPSNQAFYLIINKKAMASMHSTLNELYLQEKDEDGFLYITYASQDAFGTSANLPG